MNIKQRIDSDLKSAMLAGDKQLVTTLRTLKSALQYAEVATGTREQGMSDEAVIALLQKEAKKRQESADLYTRGGNQQKAEAELQEIAVISRYLPTPLSDEELSELVDRAVQELDEVTPQAMGKVIARVKEMSEGRADGSRVAGMVKERLMQK